MNSNFQTTSRFATAARCYSSWKRTSQIVLMVILACASLASSSEALQAENDPGHRFGDYRLTLAELGQPTRAAISTENEVFVVEAWAHRVGVYSAEGELLRSFGSLGAELGQLRDPSGVAVRESSTGLRVFVADTGNHRVVVFDQKGQGLASFGSYGSGTGNLIRPTDLAVGEDRLYVSDTGNHRIAGFDFEGKPLASFGELGSKPGQLRQPMGLAVDGAGRVLVADAGNHRIVAFTPEGELSLNFGDRGPHPGLFSLPTDVDVYGDRIYVADRGNHRIQVFSLEGERLYEWGIHVLRPRDGEGHLHYPGGIAIAPSGEFAVVCEAFSDRVQFFGPATGPVEDTMTDPAIFALGPARHFGMEIDSAGDVLLIAEPETESVLVYALADTTPLLVTRLGGFGPLADDLVRVSDVSVSRDGRRFVATDAGARRISRYSLERSAASELRFDPKLGRYVDGANLDRLPMKLDGVSISGAGKIEPGPVIEDESGRIFVVDRLSARVLLFSNRFELLEVFGGEGAGAGELRSPSDLALANDGAELWIAEAGNQRLSVFDSTGKFIRHVGERAGLVRPHGLVVDSDEIFVTDAATHQVLVFDPSGELKRSWGGEGLGAGKFYKPRGIAIDGAGHVIVLDHGNHRGQVFTRRGEFLSAFGARLYVKETRRKTSSQ